MPIAIEALKRRIDSFPRVRAAHLPTPIDRLANLGGMLECELLAKRDDATGVGFGGNKVRQLEFYIGAAIAEQATTIVITGAVQSNFARAAASMARRFGLDCHVQLEKRVPNTSDSYERNGNVLLDHLLGATLHHFPEGNDEEAADRSASAIADELAAAGRRPYVVPLGASHPPLGAIGYVLAALELADQLAKSEPIDEIYVGSGSSLTHVGLLFGLRLLEINTVVHGVCVRRDAVSQRTRVVQRLDQLAQLLDVPQPVRDDDVIVSDTTLAPGYGQLNTATTTALLRVARSEGLFLDPTYTGKVMAKLLADADRGRLVGKRVLFWHTGGQPALFAYSDQLLDDVSAPVGGGA